MSLSLTSPDSRWRSPGRLVVLLALTALPFLASAGTFFVSDDLQMWWFGATAGPGEIAWLPSRRWTWHRPLPAFSWIVNHRIAGAQVVWWHVPNVLLHVVSTVLAWRLATRLSGSAAVGALTAILFAWSPATAGTVNWISARPDLLVTAWALAALVAAYSPRLSRRPWWQAIVVGACVLAAVSSKESAFGLLPIACLLYLGPRVSSRFPAAWRLDARLAAAIVLVLGAFLLLRLALYGSTLGGYGTPLSVRRLITAPALAVSALLPPLRVLATWSGSVPGAVQLAVGALAALWGLRRIPAWTAATLAAVLPAAHLISMSVPAWEFDRFYYLSSFWIAGGLATLLVDARNSGHIRAAAAIAGVCVLSDATYLAMRTRDLFRAAQVTEAADRTLRAARTSMPHGALIWCGNLPDSLGEAYVYRNGCEEHVRLVWPRDEVTGARAGDVPPGRLVYALSADGSALRGR